MFSDGDIVCPECGNSLKLNDAQCFCSKCLRTYPNDDGIISFVEGYTKKEGYKADYFICLLEAEERHFWFKARNKTILYFIKRYCQHIIGGNHRMLEIGCGNGNVLRFLIKNGIACQGGDLFLEGLLYCRQKTEVPLFQMDALKLPFRNCYDIIGLFDVLEHIEEDTKILTQVYKALKSQKKVVITVPANEKLWGRADKYACHKRRYSKKQLVQRLEASGFTVERISYFSFLLLPALILYRRLNERRNKDLSDVNFIKRELRIAPILNTVFLWISEIERLLLHYFNLPFGSSLIAIARKE